MSWIGYKDKTANAFNLMGLSTKMTQKPAGPLVSLSHSGFLQRGTILLETSAETNGTDHLFAVADHFDTKSGLAVGMTEQQSLWIRFLSEKDTLQYDLPIQLAPGSHQMRINFSWDVAHNWAQFSVYLPKTDQIFHRFVSSPKPVTLSSLDALLSFSSDTLMDKTSFVAVSNKIEPVGPMPALAGSSQIATPVGHKKLFDLKIGDLVSTFDGRDAQIRWVGSALLPSKGSFRPICMRAPYFNLTQDAFVSGDQRILQSGSEVEYLFGEEAVLTKSRHLTNGTSILYADAPDLIRYYHVLLDRHDIINVNGCWMESFHPGHLSTDQTARSFSVLQSIPYELLPNQSELARPALKSFETVTLTSLKAA